MIGNKNNTSGVVPHMMRAFTAALFLALVGCSPAPGGPPEEKDTGSSPELPVVTAGRTDLVLGWQADGGPHVASSVSEVPEAFRDNVRVQDPTIPPEKRDPRWIFFTDLRAPGKDGRFPVKPLRRERYERERMVREKAAQKEALEAMQRAAPSAPTQPKPPAEYGKSGAEVIMYATRHCPVCKKARRWLLEQKIPYVERDVERDQSAAQDLARKGAAQGVPTSGVPVFEIRGKLLPGFDPSAIKRLLVKTLPTQNTV